MSNEKQLFQKAEHTAKLLESHKSDDELLAYLANQDSVTLNQLKIYFSNPSFTLTYFIKAIFFSSITAVIMAAFLSGQVSSSTYDLSRLFSFLFMFYLIFSFLWIAKMLTSSRKGPMQTILHFQKRAEYSRITGMIDFILDERFKKKFD
ncbi:hypothetical protein ACH95_04850 [Bacillus glycinifermentans]|uniref:YbfE n=1 Tax=Bacillus glycinifermentans TaxID=1664069 RepID=A0A0J6DZG4_9BACI|nr:hypothetical protein [Bacillus glycinifermentans]ATH94189.1 hypothetical protein COP00_17550 [Bacillus glycinifermentans]KMM62810.1 hypothetical protein ACH95_04850 [Bacillus glycinifermentans]KRT95612.1 hypothetical protein AB447_200420 [Bacillus glycinifermentans]MEC0484509.1 hypothetical protein [Bacillus glycinifermentans]MEC0496901.1 hypothetical protein [Bacillus glycinifermentans]